jgi:hypothetical protein
MVRIEDLTAYVGTVAAITGALAAAMNATPTRLVQDEPRPSPARRAVAPVLATMPEEYRRELSRGLAACFDAENPPSQQMMDDINSMYFFGQRYELGGRWSSTASGSAGVQGDPMTLLWSFVPDGLSIPNGVGEGVANSQLFSRMDTLFAAVGGRARWVQQFVRCFQRYEALSGITYSRVTVGGNDWDDGASWSSSGAIGLRGDVRISMKNIDGVNGVLAYDQFPGAGSGGNMVIDSSESWATGSSGNTPFRFLRNTVMHEHGHGLGFAHVCPINNNKLMEPFLNTNFDGPQQDEIRAVQRQYGDIYEPNNNAGASVDLGTLNIGGGFVLGAMPTTVPGDTIIYPNLTNASTCSIDANGEQDWYKFTASTNMLASITVAPVGSSYTAGPQTQACDTGDPVNGLAIADLTLRIFSSSGVNTIAFQNATAAGSSEVIPNFLFTGGEVYHVVVLENGTPAESQLYRLTVTANGATSVTATDAASPDTINVSWSNVPGATGYQVYRGATNDFAAATLVASPAVNSYADTGLPAGQSYFYWVRATQAFGGFTSTQSVGGPEQGSTTAAANNAPTANAGPDQSLRDPQGDNSQAVSLNGSASTDSDGTIVSYAWSEGGSPLASGATPTVNLPAGVHTITLTVTDDDGAVGTDTVIVTITNNQAPTADAGPDQAVTDADNSGGEVVSLDGSGSDDPDGTIASYRWTEGGVEIGTGINPAILFELGVHTVTLTVTDNEGRTASDTLLVQVDPGTPACRADFNGDGFLDFFDYDDYVACFETGTCPPGKDADFNGDGFADFFDYDDFVSAFELGC